MPSAASARLPPEVVAGTIISHDDDHVYLRKPVGLPVFPASGSNAPTLVDAYGAALRTVAARSSFSERVLSESWPAGFELGIAHRLDTMTSGVVVAARTLAGLLALRSQFAAKEIRKFYLFRSAAHRPYWPNGQRVCALPIAHHKTDKRKMVVGLPPLADPSVPDRRPDIPHKGRWHPAYTIFRPLPPTSPILPSLLPDKAGANRVLADPLLVQSVRAHQRRAEDDAEKAKRRKPGVEFDGPAFLKTALASVNFDRFEGFYTAEMRTGVTHQLRVHALACGIPIMGDTLYDPDVRRAKMAGVTAATKEFLLHCYQMQGPEGSWSTPLLPLVDDLRLPPDVTTKGNDD
ncbi:pseudouridine synthase [Hyaloraphidium curvatum]|nr:pseudouridine synthase [Hyaloraphidium curvatum]